jgi:predicted enzyme involved in methoxymalonyl-ACP biosynthesis
MAGRTEGNKLVVDHWVMSCRAFSRRIEHGSLLRVFEKFSIESAEFDYVKTQRNQPIRDFFTQLTGEPDAENYSLTKQQLFDKCPAVYLDIQELKSE